jgi:hypothetical protein
LVQRTHHRAPALPRCRLVWFLLNRHLSTCVCVCLRACVCVCACVFVCVRDRGVRFHKHVSKHVQGVRTGLGADNTCAENTCAGKRGDEALRLIKPRRLFPHGPPESMMCQLGAQHLTDILFQCCKCFEQRKLMINLMLCAHDRPEP